MIVEIKEVAATPEAVILQFNGELDVDCIKSLIDSFNDIDADKKYIIADVGNVDLISSAAIGEFMGVRKMMLEKNGDLVFAAMNLEIRTKLSLMGANKIFRFFNDVRAAVQFYKKQSSTIPEVLEISFPANLQMVPPIRQLSSRIAKQKGYGIRDSFRIETIVDEICNNAIEHGKQGENQSIDLRIGVDNKQIELDVLNESDPEKIATLKMLLKPKEEHELKSDAKRGRGLSLIKMLSDELSVECSEKGTIVHVKKVREEKNGIPN